MILLAAYILLTAPGQEPAASGLVDGDCSGCVITRTEQFEGAALAGHINGGAELYKEYGFVSLTAQEVRLSSGEDLIVESYRMRSPDAAYGMFSISRHACGEGDTTFMYSCAGPYQIQCAAGEWYLRIMNGSGSAAAREHSTTLLRALVARTGQVRLPVPPLFATPATADVQDGILLITGPLGIQNGMPDWEDLLDGISEFTLRAVRLKDEGGVLAELQLSGEQEAVLVAERLGVGIAVGSMQETPGTRKRFVLWASPLRVRILETTARSPVIDPLLQALSSAEY